MSTSRRLPQDRIADRAKVLTVAEEQLAAAKRKVPEGAVRVDVEAETFQEFARAEFEPGGAEITRIAIEQVVDRIPEIRTDATHDHRTGRGRVHFVEKRRVLKEGLHIRRPVETQTTGEAVALRR